LRRLRGEGGVVAARVEDLLENYAVLGHHLARARGAQRQRRAEQT
jgi:hypothetical protein